MKDNGETRIKKNSFLKAIIVFFIIIILGLVGYICYDKGAFDNLFVKNLKPSESEKIANKLESVKVVSDEYVGEDHLESESYLIAKINGEWKELDNDVLVYFGAKNNKLYYANSEEFKYIDLNNENYEPTTWIKYEEKDYASGIFIGYVTPDNGVLKEDTIYYYQNNGPAKIKTLKLDATKYSDIKEVGTELDDFSFYLSDDNKLFYTEFIMGESTGKFVSYDLNKKEKKVIIDKNVYSSEFYKDKALIVTQTESDGEFLYKLYLYDLKTLEKKYVADTEYYGGVVGDTVYYLDGDNTMKYENGQKSLVYKYDAPKGIDEYAVRGIIAYNENLLKYGLGSSSNDFFVSNGKVVSSKEAQTLVDRYDVKMKDGKTKTFYGYEVKNQYIDLY